MIGSKDGAYGNHWRDEEHSPKRNPTLDERIASEKRYHEDYYDENNIPPEVCFDLAMSAKRRRHNLTWAYYDTIIDQLHGNVVGKKVLVVGCGDGLVALNLAKHGAQVDAFDLCEKAISICEKRAKHNGVEGVHFFVSSCEKLDLQSGSYDAVVGEMILHHIDIPTAMNKCHVWLKPGGVGIFMEWKKYAIIDSVRNITLFRRLFPPGGWSGYATEYERKLTRFDFEIIRERFPVMRLDYRYCLRGKLDYFVRPSLAGRVEKLDYLFLRAFPFVRPFFSDGVVISFRNNDPPKG